MKQVFENILKASSELKDSSYNFIVRQLKIINEKLNYIIAKNDSYKSQLSGVKPTQYNEILQKAIDLLKLLGFTEIEFNGMNPDFLNWMFENSVTIKKYNPRMMNFYLLRSMQQAYFLTYAEKQGEKPTYIEVRNTMLTFNDQIDELKKELKLSLPELIEKIDGKS